MIIKRQLIKEISPFLDNKEYIAITGPRQSGKSVFLDLIKNYLIENERVNPVNIKQVTFEDRILLNQFDNDPIAFVNSYKNNGQENNIFYLTIDEFQYSINGGQKLKLIYDTIGDVKIIITGSSSLDIKAQVGKYMVGRILTFHLCPFNFSEFLVAKNSRLAGVYQKENSRIIKWFLENERIENELNKKDAFKEEFLKLFEEYCVWGGYPRVVLSETENEKKKILNDIHNNYIMKDIKGLLELATDKNLLLLGQFLATQIGNILVYKNLGQAAKLDYRKIIEHLNILQETYIIDLVRPFFKNSQKELSKNPKVYFFDLGFRNSLINNVNPFYQRGDFGAMVENVTFLKLKIFLGDSGKINFWRTKIGAEVDFVCDIGGEIFPLEVKFSEFRKPEITKGFGSFLKNFKPQKALVLTKDYFGLTKIENCQVLFCPAYYF